jgi:hypothetical protein
VSLLLVQFFLMPLLNSIPRIQLQAWHRAAPASHGDRHPSELGGLPRAVRARSRWPLDPARGLSHRVKVARSLAQTRGRSTRPGQSPRSGWPARMGQIDDDDGRSQRIRIACEPVVNT